MKISLSANPRTNLLLLGLMATSLVWVGNTQLRDYLVTNFIASDFQPAMSRQKIDHLKHLYPLVATAKVPSIAQMPTPASGVHPLSLDQLFGKGDRETVKQQKEKKPAATDYFAALSERKRSLLSLDGLSPGKGAFINGAYIPINGPVDSVSYPANASASRMVTPRLVAVTDTSATIQEPSGRRTITLQLEQHH